MQIISKKQNRNRILYLAIIVVIIIVGLSTRKFPEIYPSLFAEFGGDILWATMVYFGFAFVFKKLEIIKIALFSIFFSYFIEISQLYHANWIDYLRNTTIGALILGFGFLWSDIICYTIGILLGIIFEIIVLKNKKDK